MTDTAAVSDSDQPDPRLHHILSNGLTLACCEWRAALRGSSPTLFMVHATGFHARVWDQVITRLPGRHVIAIDQRGHGRSEAAPFASWEAFGRDLAGAGGRVPPRLRPALQRQTHFLPMEDPALMAQLINEVAPLPVA